MIKWHLIKGEIQKNESLKISIKDVDKNIKEIIDKNPTQKKEIKDYYKQESNKNQLYQNMLDEILFNNLKQYFINQTTEQSTDKLREQRK